MSPRPKAALGGTILTVGIATLGVRVAAVAVPWFVLVTTGSAAQTGLVVAAELAPYVVCKALAGPLVDRLGQYRVSIAADMVVAVLFALVPILHAAGALGLPALLALVAVAGAFRGPADTAKHTLVPLLATATGTPLSRATGLLGAGERTAGLVGPALAAALTAVAGPTAAVAVTAGTAAASAAVLAITRTPLAVHDTTSPASSYLADLRDGWTFIGHDPLLRGLGVMILFTNLLDVSYSSVLLPLWATTGGHGVEAVGLLLTCMAGASVLSSALASVIGDRLPRRTTYFVGFLLAGPLRIAVLALDPSVPVIVGVMVLSGLGSGVLNPVLGAIVYERIPAAKLGRVAAPLDALAWAGMPVGGIFAAALVGLLGLGSTLLGVAGLYLLAVIVPAATSRATFDPVRGTPDLMPGEGAPAPIPREPARRRPLGG
ncbi:MFS transporter [Propionicicella superfundia]|uniref:MFS transporter n=1 Tax=Propionicicella superfundia TaxID=348582 RepID=UPI00042703EA|nr:MFS transporter [Propionicicella superfundia]